MEAFTNLHYGADTVTQNVIIHQSGDFEELGEKCAKNGFDVPAKNVCENLTDTCIGNEKLKTETAFSETEADKSSTTNRTCRLENLWQIFYDFEMYSYDPSEISFTGFLTEWQSRLNTALKCGLQYSETILSLKLIKSSNLDSVTRSDIFSTVSSHLETNLLLFTLSALNSIKDEDKENQIKLEDSEAKKSFQNIGIEDMSDHETFEVPVIDNHSDIEETKKSLKCEHCPRTFQRAQEYQKHLSCHTGPKKSHVCVVCLASFNKKSMLDEHMLVHAEKNRLKCAACDKEFFSDKALKHHMKNVHKKHLRCDQCEKMFDRQSKLTKHMETHAKRFAANEGYFQCDQCGKEMQGKKRLRIHKRTHFQFKCQPCNKIFKDQDLLNRHVLNHKEYGCDQCGQVFFQHALLIKHKNTITHGGERKFACDLCGKTFMKKYNLQTHQLTHFGEKNFKCEYEDCSMAFYKKDVMVRHMRIHTGERPYQCDICERRFTQSGDLRKHRRTHGVE